MTELPIRRTFAGLDHDVWEPIETIRSLLADVYRYDPDGRTILRECVQNADDARAEQLAFLLVHEGFEEATNTLLMGPALLVINDGPFPEPDHDGLHRAIGGAKRDDASKVGRFGLGLKSVFHLCEAFLYIGREDGAAHDRIGALNPWAGTGPRSIDSPNQKTGRDPLHPDWDSLDDADYHRLRALGVRALPAFERQGLLLWLPLRRRHDAPKLTHLNRGEDAAHEYGISDRRLVPSEVLRWFDPANAKRLLLSQAGSLRAAHFLDVARAGSGVTPNLIRTVERPRFRARGWLDRPSLDDPPRDQPIRAFEGEISESGTRWRVQGRDVRDDRRLEALRQSRPDWPRDIIRLRGGRSREQDRKVLGHAGVTVIRPFDTTSPSSIRLRWCAFFPLDDAPNPLSDSPLVQVCPGIGVEGKPWDVLLHGYFWPAQDRRSIPGVAETGERRTEPSSDDLRVVLNRTMRDDLLLPLLPGALSDVCRGLAETSAHRLVECVATTCLWEDANRGAVTRDALLLPMLEKDGVAWSTAPTDSDIVALGGWAEAPHHVRGKLAETFRKRFPGTVLISADAARLGGLPRKWLSDEVALLLELVQVESLREGTAQEWLARALVDAAGGRLDSPIVDAFADWVARRLGEGALHQKTQDRWAELFEVLPAEWRVSVPKGARGAVAELGEARQIGRGLIPVPLGRSKAPAEKLEGGRPSAEVAQAALRWLGARLGDRTGSSAAVKSRLLLAESLLGALAAPTVLASVEDLPLLRAHRLPEEKDEAWSVARLRKGIDQQRVFARVEESPSDEVAPESEDDEPPATPVKKTAMALAKALGEPVWLVVPDAVPGLRPASTSSHDALARALRASANPLAKGDDRKQLLAILAHPEGVGAEVLAAVRALLTGGPDEDGKHALYYVRSDSVSGDKIAPIAETLLRLLERAWTLVDPSLVEPLPHKVVQQAKAATCDTDSLHSLLKEALAASNVRWHALSESDAQRMVEVLHPQPTDEEGRHRWQKMPLHRTVDGTRTALGPKCRLPVSGVRLPATLTHDLVLLAPDEGLEAFYSSATRLTSVEALRVILASADVRQFAFEILELLKRGLRGQKGEIALPEDKELREQLTTVAWMPLTVGEAVAPADVLILPEVLEPSIRELFRAERARRPVLPSELAPAIAREGGALVRMLSHNRGPREQVTRLAELLGKTGARTTFALSPVELEEWVLKLALETSLVTHDPGWKLWGDAARALSATKDELPEAALKLAAALVGPVPLGRQIAILNALAESRPAQESATGKVHAALLAAFKPLARSTIRALTLPTQDGAWHASDTIACTASGVARKHLLRSDLREVLALDEDAWEHAAPLPDAGPDMPRQDERLRAYFEAWNGRVPREAVGTFLALLGDWPASGAVEGLAQEWLGNSIEVADLRAKLVGEDWRRPPPPYVIQPFARGKDLTTNNLAGERFRADADEGDNPSLFAVDPILGNCRPGERCFELTLREASPEATSQELLERLGRAVEWWALSVLRVERNRVQTFWIKWGQGSQAALTPVRASILAHLPLTLRQLNVADCPSLDEHLKKAERAQQRRDQAPPGRVEAAVRDERHALDALATALLKSDEHHGFLLGRIRDRITSFGYRPSSMLLELTQNADDALAQAEEIRRGPLPDGARTLFVKVHASSSKGRGEVTTIDVTHYGRAVNDSGGRAFPSGVERQWDMDLYFMMLMNLSAKPGDATAALSATTGRFGLGFKAVHLITDGPEVVSGFLTFGIVAGLLPEELPRHSDPSLNAVEGFLPTRLRLPLRGDASEAKLLEEVFARFSATKALILCFSRSLVRIVVEGGPRPGRARFDGRPLVGGWSVSAEPCDLGETHRWLLLRFARRDAGHPYDRTALVLGMQEGTIAPLPDTVPFLWNVLPTGEAWNVGYAVNGAVKLDPGRTHVALDDEATREVFASLGRGLGGALVALHDALGSATRDVMAALALDPGDVEAFIASMWRTLARGLDLDDPKRAELLHLLHGPDRGLQHWMRERSVVPTTLPPPFAPFLPAGDSFDLFEVTEPLSRPTICAALSHVENVKDMLRGYPAVAAPIAASLRHIVKRGRLKSLVLTDVLAGLVERWNKRLTPGGLASLVGLVHPDDIWKLVKGECPEWARELTAVSESGSRSELKNLLVRHASVEGDSNTEEEELRVAFAPFDRVLAADYVSTDDAALVFRRLRGPFHADAQTLAKWVLETPKDKRREAMRYLAIGSLRGELIAHIRAGIRPEWLKTFETVEALLKDAGVDEPNAKGVLAQLFPERAFGSPVSGLQPLEPPLQPLPRGDAQCLVRELHDLWSSESYRREKLEAARSRWYPAGWTDERLRDALLKHPSEEDESQTAWMILFTLATVQGLGRTQPEQHKGFVEALMSRRLDGQSWWSFLFGRYSEDSNERTWFRFLEGWADAHVDGRLTYDHWFTTLPELFAAWRWLPEYRHLVLSAQRRTEGTLDALFRPRVDAEQDRGGSAAPALPVVRHHWLLSELLRIGVLKPTSLLDRSAWPPSRRLVRNLELLGFEASLGASFSAKTLEFMTLLLGPGRDPTFFGCYEKPLVSDEFTARIEEECRARGLDTPDREEWDDLGSGRYGDVPDEDDIEWDP